MGATTASRKKYLQTARGKETSRRYYLYWRTANREKYLASLRKSDLKRHYGMTPEGWDAMFEGQGKCCAVCKVTHSGRKCGKWCTDHDHKTGKVRGIICNGCNVALGQVKDDPSRLRALALYLEERGELPCQR